MAEREATAARCPHPKQRVAALDWLAKHRVPRRLPSHLERDNCRPAPLSERLRVKRQPYLLALFKALVAQRGGQRGDRRRTRVEAEAGAQRLRGTAFEGRGGMPRVGQWRPTLLVCGEGTGGREWAPF